LVKILQVSFNGGSILKNDLLQAKIDKNVYTENAIVQELTISIAKKHLNQLLGLSTDSLFEVVDSIPLNYSVDKNELFQKLNAANTSILSRQKQLDIAKLNLKEYSSYRLPVLNLNAGYYLSATDNSAGAMQKNRLFGPQIGGNLTIPIYQAGQVNRQISTAKIEVESAQFNLENIKLQVNTQLLNAIEAFEYQERLLEIEKENNQYATEYLQISFNRMKFGQTNSLEVHQGQENYVQSCTRLINFRYNLKIAETKLKQLISKM
jgi:outer membrane protein TolC